MTAIINTYNKDLEIIYDFTFDRIKRYYKGKLNSYKDEPAIISNRGIKMWYKNGLQHRENDKPAVTYENGSEFYFQNDKLHRDNNKPAWISYSLYEEDPLPKIEYWTNGRIRR